LVNNFILSPIIHKNIFFIGIGGVSMSGIAEALNKSGYRVSGSDISASAFNHLNGLGIKTYLGHDKNHIGDCSLVVHTAAVGEDNAELKYARETGVAVIDRAQLLGSMMKNYKNAIAVAGTHGKTTTTALITEILLRAGCDPTAFIGGYYKPIGGNVRVGASGYCVAEACEYKDSFLNFYPRIGVVLNIEEDHLDYFTDIGHIRASFNGFINNIPAGGALVINAGCGDLKKLCAGARCEIVTFDETGADWTAEGMAENGGFFKFTPAYKNERFERVTLRVPGKYNALNALAAIAACRAAGINAVTAVQAVSDFNGAGRRFEYKGEVNGARVYDDYAHHPTEIKAALAAARRICGKKIFCAFQPHNYSRTRDHFGGFTTAFDEADEILLFDIYSDREINESGVTSEDLAHAVNKRGKKARYYENFERAAEYILSECTDGDLIFTMGAGDVYKLQEYLI